MALSEILHKIDELQKQANALRPISKSRLDVLHEKLRLEWNYHSNAIEGNTLTMSETRMLLIHGYHTGNKLGRHYEEMKLHDEVLAVLEDLVSKNEPISEVLIRNLHSRLMGENYFVKAYDSVGQVINVKGHPGEYKTKVNGVSRVVNGNETFVHFKTPDEVRIEMPELIEWYRTEEERKELHPVELAAIFHYRFVTLHPFDDGNGRMSRLLMNMILMRAGYVPAIIRLEEREQYIYALATAQDGGSLEPFIEIVARETERSLNLLIKAAKGESIDEPGDIDKQIELVKRRVEGQSDVTTKVSKDILELTVIANVFPLLESFEAKCFQLRNLFHEFERTMNCRFGGITTTLGVYDSNWSQLRVEFKDRVSQNSNLLSSIDYSYSLKGYKKSLTVQYMAAYVNFNFNEFNYSIRINNDHQNQLTRSYDSILEEPERDRIVKKLVDQILDQIKNASGLK